MELRWSAKPLDFRQLAPHLVMLYGCPDPRAPDLVLGIYRPGSPGARLHPAAAAIPLPARRARPTPPRTGRNLREWLRTKFRAAETEQKPFVRVRVRGT